MKALGLFILLVRAEQSFEEPPAAVAMAHEEEPQVEDSSGGQDVPTWLWVAGGAVAAGVALAPPPALRLPTADGTGKLP